MGQHARAAAGAWVADVVPGDVLVTSIRPIPAEEGVADVLAAVADVTSVSPIATFDLAVDGQATDGAAMVGSDLAADGRLTLRSGDRATAFAALDAGGAAIVGALADRLHLSVGSQLSVTTVQGTPLSVAWSLWPNARCRAAWRGGHRGWRRHRPSWRGRRVMSTWSGSPRNATPVDHDALETAATLAALEVVPLAQVQGAIDDALLRVFGLFDALAIIAVIVAALGIANTLTMNVSNGSARSGSCGRPA